MGATMGRRQQRTLAQRRLRTFADLNFRVVNMLKHFAEIAHVEPKPTARAISENDGHRSRHCQRTHFSPIGFT
jgi:hypothetical protein